MTIAATLKKSICTHFLTVHMLVSVKKRANYWPILCMHTCTRERERERKKGGERVRRGERERERERDRERQRQRDRERETETERQRERETDREREREGGHRERERERERQRERDRERETETDRQTERERLRACIALGEGHHFQDGITFGFSSKCCLYSKYEAVRFIILLQWYWYSYLILNH